MTFDSAAEDAASEDAASPAPSPAPLFILCPPRSFSSIVCGMLGQHPQCYGLPELNLFVGETLGEAYSGFGGRSIGRDGLLRTLAQLHDGEQTEDSVARAEEWVRERTDWPVEQVWAHLQECVGPRMLVEKSPSIAFKREFLERMLRIFPTANLLHLVRHPRSTAESVTNLRNTFNVLEQIGRKGGFDPERVWRVTHSLIIEETAELPLGQYMRVKGETLLSKLDTYLPQICEWLGIRSDAEAIAAMMHPETSPFARPGPSNAPRGNDPNFLENPRLDPDRLAALREPSLEGELSWRPGETFTAPTVKLARQFGYS